MNNSRILDLNILYIDDENEATRVTLTKLESYVKKIFFVENSNEGLELYNQLILDKQNKIDIVIIDINTSDSNNFDILVTIREMEPDINVILTTYNDSEDFLAIAKKFGLNYNYLIKPYNFKTLLDKLEINEGKINNKKKFNNLQKLHSQYEYAVNEKMLVSKTDLKGRITYVNKKLCEVSGYTKEELLGKPHSIVKNPKTPAKVFEDLWKTISSGNVFEGIITNRKKDGTDYIVDTIILPIFDMNDNIEEYISIRADITSYVKKRDEEVNIMQDKTLMLFTHELKSPLNAIMAFNSHINRNLHTELSDKKIQRMQDLSKTIDANSKSLLSIINTMLDISKLKSNKLNFNLEQFDLISLINEKIDTYSVLHTREVSVEMPEVLDVFLDYKSLNHIIENLFTNAIKYSTSKVLVKVELQNDDILISIEDDGDGILIENREMIFNMFTQESEGRSYKEKSGTGVGLHLVKLLCDNNNFDIKVSSSLKLKGASFIVKIKNYKESKCIK
jgi:PAS domain S-box-containing protein